MIGQRTLLGAALGGPLGAALGALLGGPASAQTDVAEVYERLETRAASHRHVLDELTPELARTGEFWLLGPFPYAGHGVEDLAREHPPETELATLRANGPGPDLDRVWAGKDGAQARWTSLGAIANRRVELRVHERDALNRLATCFLWGTLESDEARTVELTLGSDDGLYLWLNGELVLERDVPRGLDPAADTVELDLAAGTNHLVAEVAQGYGDWAFQLTTRSALTAREDAELAYLLDRDFPLSPARRHWRVLTVPAPDDLVLEIGGLAFWPDGRPLVTTRRGDVLLVENAYEEPPTRARYRTFASGLHEPLGAAVRVEDGRPVVYTMQRPELTRLVDTDGDLEADLYETFCDGWGVSGNYHEFAFGPKFDLDGNAWVALNVGFCGSLGKSLVPWRGWALRVTPDGVAHPVCTGVRSPNGLGMNAAGVLFYVDNQGDWIATNRLAELREGSFHGQPAGLDWWERYAPGEPKPTEPFPASVWFPYGVMGQSAADLALDDTGGAFGPFEGQLFVGDQTKASVMRVFLEEVDGFWQGACFPFLEDLQSGVNRVAFAPDGSLFVGQTDRGWGSVGRRRFGLERVVFTGETPFEIRAMRVTPDGFALELTVDVDPTSAADPASYSMTAHTYEYHADYGSPEVDTGPREIAAVRVVSRREVELVVPDRRANYVHGLVAAGLRSAAGEPLLHPRAWYTVQRLPGR